MFKVPMLEVPENNLLHQPLALPKSAGWSAMKHAKSVVVGFACLTLSLLAVGIKPAQAELITGLTTTNQLLSFDSASPNTIQSSVSISGLLGGDTLLGLDYRPANGALYGFGSGSRLYTINATTGVASLASTLSTPATGTSFGVDFNPVPDRLRLISDNDQNFRINVDTGAVTVDGTLAYAAGDASAGANPNIVGSAYTNNFAGATTTTLYNIDSNLDRLVIQNPPNNGVLNTVGNLGFDTGDQVGFDISGSTGAAYASLTGQGASSSGFFTINLATGQATQVGMFGNGVVLRDISVSPVPEPSTYAMMALGVAAMALISRKRKKGENLTV